MLDYRVETFLVVCREMNYTKAAEVLNITQPNVSQHIKWLEDLYQQKLFAYQGRKLILTPAGEVMKKAAIAIRHEEKLLRQQMAAVQDQKKPLAFGVTKSISEGFMKMSINHFLEKYTGDRIYFSVNNTHQLLEEINNMKLDFAIVEGNFDKNIYDYIVLTKERFIPVCAADYVFKKEITCLEDLFEEPFIIREQGSGSREILENMLGSRNYTFQNFQSVLEIGDISITKELLKGGRGIAFLYEMAVEQELQTGRLKEIRLGDWDVRHEFALVWLKTKHFFYYYQELAEHLKNSMSVTKRTMTEQNIKEMKDTFKKKVTEV